LAKHIPVSGLSVLEKDQKSEEDERIRKKLALNFVRDNQGIYGTLTGALNEGDIKRAHRIAHTLKSSAGQIGEKDLQYVSGVLEILLSEGENLASRESLNMLKKELDSVLRKLQPMLDEYEGTKIELITDKNVIRGIYDGLLPLLKGKDTESLSFVDKLRAVRGTEALVEGIEDFNFTHAVRLLEGMITELETLDG
jgi:HPt (histidine-containing phosphotransfer) domain-containing protein